MKALSPNVVTLAGMTMLVSDAQLVNACSAIVFNFAGNITDLMPLPLKTPRMVVVAFSGVRSIVLRAVQFSKQ